MLGFLLKASSVKIDKKTQITQKLYMKNYTWKITHEKLHIKN